MSILPSISTFRRVVTRVVPLTCVAAISACQDDAPVAPPQPREVQSPVVRIVVTGARQVLAPGDSTRFTAQAFDAQGLVIPTAVIAWSSRAASVASIDARGVAVGIGVGTTEIVATADAVSGSAELSVSVTELCECTRIIDSTSVELVRRNDTTGVFVFRVIGSQVPVIDSGSVIVGAENGGFLRRVHHVSRSGNDITLQTTQAYLEEAIRDAAFAATSFSEGEEAPLADSSARWGPWTVAYLAPNVRLARAKCCTLDDISISLLEIGKDVKVTGEVAIKKGNISFEPRLQLSGQFSSFKLQRFRTALGGAVDLNIEEYEAKVAFEYETGKKLWTSVPKKKRRMARLVKPFAFSIGPVPVVGIINKEVNLEVTVGGSASTGFKGKFRTGFGLSAGAEWARGRGWSPVTGSSSWLDVSAPEFIGVEGEATVKIALVPEYSILFYGVGGPFINLEPYAQGVANAVLSFDGGKPSGLDWELKAEVGLNTNIGAKLSIFGFVDLVEAGFEIPIIRPFTLVRAFSDGPLTARTTITGPDQPEAINIRLRPTFEDVWQMGALGIITRSGPPPLGRDLATSSQDESVEPNGSATFQNVRSGDDFKHRVGLNGLAGNCAADTASFDVAVKSGAFLTLSQQAASDVTFKITCIPLGALQVRTVATGQDVVARSQLTLARRDTIGSGKGSPPLTVSIPTSSAPPDTIIDELAPANAALGTVGLHDATLDPGRRNCAVAKPATHRSAVASGDTAFTEFRLTCVALGHVMVRTVTTDPDSAPPSAAVTYTPVVTARDAADQVPLQPIVIGASASSIVSGLVPVYNASGASGRHNVRLTDMPNRCSHVGPAGQAVTVFPGDTALAPFTLRCVERLHVSTNSTGPGSDRDGYVAVIEYADGTADSATVPVSGTTGVDGVRPGTHTIRLTDVDPNCNAPASVRHAVSGRDSTLVSLTVHCPGPAAPTGLRATQILTDEIDLAWDAPPPGRVIAHYRLYRTSGSPSTTVVLDSLPGVTFDDSRLTPATSYSYQLAAVDTDGLVGPRSSVLRVRTLDSTPPSTPANLFAIAISSSRINLSWNAASDAESGISRYRVYRDGTLVDSTAATTYASMSLTPRTTYSYYIVAVNGQGLASSQSNTASATTLDASPPSAPSGLSATAVSTSQIDLAWSAATDAESGIARYRIYRGGTLVGTSSALTFTDAGLTPATTYSYEVSAVNGDGLEGPRTGPATATTHAAITGDLVVNVGSLGPNIPAGGYQVQVTAGNVLLTQPVAPNAATTFAALTPQTYTVSLVGLPSNCAVDDGPNPRSVVVPGGATASTSFRVRCN